MMDTRSIVTKAGVELKIALFCVVLMILAYVYMLMEPVLGAYVLKVSIITFIMSLVVFFYKVIFGSITEFLALIILASLYICGLAKIFNAIPIMKIAFFVALLSCAIKAFTAIFFNSSSRTSNKVINNDLNLKCPNCGAEIEADDTFCTHCGKKLK